MLSKISARVGLSDKPRGGGNWSHNLVISSSIPCPVLAETRIASSALNPSTCSISSATSTGRADGRSILLMTGMMSNPTSIAAYALATVCACTPCVASTTRIAPSHAWRAFCTS